MTLGSNSFHIHTRSTGYHCSKLLAVNSVHKVRTVPAGCAGHEVMERIKIPFREKLGANSSQGMLAVIRSRIFCPQFAIQKYKDLLAPDLFF